MVNEERNLPPVRSARQLGNTIKRLRRETQFSQTELATLSGLRQAGISQLETGALGVRLESLFRILAALELEIIIRKRSRNE